MKFTLSWTNMCYLLCPSIFSVCYCYNINESLIKGHIPHMSKYYNYIWYIKFYFASLISNRYMCHYYRKNVIHITEKNETH